MYRNEVILEGSVATTPEVRITKSGIPVVNLRLYTERQREQPGDSSPEYVSVVCWRQLSEIAAQLEKGDQVLVNGYLHSFKSTDPNTKRTIYGQEAVAISLEPLTLKTPMAGMR